MPKNIYRDYGYHPPTDSIEAAGHEVVCQRLQALAEWCEVALPEGREKALVHTHLETALMWANAAVARARYDKAHQ